MQLRAWLLPALALGFAGLGCQMATLLLGTPTAAPAGAPTRAPTMAPTATARSEPTAAASKPQEYEVPDEGRFHIEPGQTGKYAHYPPSSGVHYGQVVDWGFYNEAVPAEYWVHNLEHGGVVVLYNCPGGCQDVEAVIWQLIERAPPEQQFNEVKILVSPNGRIEHKVVVLAWDYQLDLDGADLAILLDFYNRHVDQGPEAVP